MSGALTWAVPGLCNDAILIFEILLTGQLKTTTKHQNSSNHYQSFRVNPQFKHFHLKLLSRLVTVCGGHGSGTAIRVQYQLHERRAHEEQIRAGRQKIHWTGKPAPQSVLPGGGTDFSVSTRNSHGQFKPDQEKAFER